MFGTFNIYLSLIKPLLPVEEENAFHLKYSVVH